MMMGTMTMMMTSLGTEDPASLTLTAIAATSIQYRLHDTHIRCATTAREQLWYNIRPGNNGSQWLQLHGSTPINPSGPRELNIYREQIRRGEEKDRKTADRQPPSPNGRTGAGAKCEAEKSTRYILLRSEPELTRGWLRNSEMLYIRYKRLRKKGSTPAVRHQAAHNRSSTTVPANHHHPSKRAWKIHPLGSSLSHPSTATTTVAPYQK